MPRHTTKTIKSWGAESSVIVLVRAREYVGWAKKKNKKKKTTQARLRTREDVQ